MSLNAIDIDFAEGVRKRLGFRKDARRSSISLCLRLYGEKGRNGMVLTISRWLVWLSSCYRDIKGLVDYGCDWGARLEDEIWRKL